MVGKDVNGIHINVNKAITIISKTIGVRLSSFKNNCCMQLVDLNQ